MNEKPAFPKSPWRFAFLALAIFAALDLFAALFPGAAVQLLLKIYEWNPSGTAVSVGIIGGADGPTAIFLTTSPVSGAVVPAILLILGIAGYLRLRRCKPEN